MRPKTWILVGIIAGGSAVTGWMAFDAFTPAHHMPAMAGAAPVKPAISEAETATESGALRSLPSEGERRVLARLEERRARVEPTDLPALARTIVREAERHGIDPELVLAVIDVESSYHLQAISPVGARGLMQVMPSTGKAVAKRLELPWRGDESLFDPHFNVTLGVAYLGQLKQRFGDIEKSLAAYNWGPSRIERFLRNGEGLPRTYVENVFTTYESARRPRTSGS